MLLRVVGVYEWSWSWVGAAQSAWVSFCWCGGGEPRHPLEQHGPTPLMPFFCLNTTTVGSTSSFFKVTTTYVLLLSKLRVGGGGGEGRGFGAAAPSLSTTDSDARGGPLVGFVPLSPFSPPTSRRSTTMLCLCLFHAARRRPQTHPLPMLMNGLLVCCC